MSSRLTAVMTTASLKNKSRILFAQFVGTGLAALAVLGVLFYLLYLRIISAASSLIGKAEAMCGCNVSSSFSDHPWMYAALFGAGIAGFAFMAAGVVGVARLYRRTFLFIRAHISKRSLNISDKLMSAAREIGIDGKVVEIASDTPAIFCFGFVHPRICVSTELARRLAPDELKAALLHEEHHLMMREPLKFFIVKALRKILAFLPGMAVLAKQFFVFSELAADERATDHFQNRVPLARALSKIIEWQEGALARNNVAISFLGSATEERVNRLVDSSYAPKQKGAMIKSLAFIAVSAVSLAAFNSMIASSDINFQHEQMGDCALSTHEAEAGGGECGAKHYVKDCSMSYTAPLNNCGK